MLLRVATVFLILAVLVVWFVLRPMLKLRAVTRTKAPMGAPQIARVVSAVSTGASAAGMPRLEAVLDLFVPGQPARRITVQQMIGLAPLPSPGDSVYVVEDGKVRNRWYLLAGRTPPADPEKIPPQGPASERSERESQQFP